MSFQRDAAGFFGPVGKGPRRSGRKRKAPAAKAGEAGFTGALEQGHVHGASSVQSPQSSKRFAQDVPDRSRHVGEQGPSVGAAISSTIAEPNFKRLDYASLTECFHLYDTDALLRIVSNVMLNSVLGGGIDIIRPGFVLTATARAFYQRCWSAFVRSLMRSLWSAGFAAVVLEPHPMYKAVPHVLELNQVETRMYQDRWGLRHYIFFDRSSPTAFAGGVGRALGLALPSAYSMDEPIASVLVFELSPPSAEGHIQSHVASLRDEMRYHRRLVEADWRAICFRTQPLLFATQSQPRANTQAVPRPSFQRTMNEISYGVPNDREDLSSLNGAPFSRPQVFESERSARDAQLMDAADMLNRGLNPFNAGKHVPGPVPVIDVNGQRELTAPPTAEEPLYLMEARIALEERTGAAFGVPRSMFSRYSAQNRGGEESSRLVFLESSRALKNELIPILVATFLSIYHQEFVADAATIALSDNLTFDASSSSVDVGFQLPGVPPPTVIASLWREGSLKREAYLNYMSHLYGLPYAAFTPQPGLSIKELAGIPPPVAPTASKPGEKKKPKAGGGKGGAGLKPPGQSVVFAPSEAHRRAEAAEKAMNEAQQKK